MGSNAGPFLWQRERGRAAPYLTGARGCGEQMERKEAPSRWRSGQRALGPAERARGLLPSRETAVRADRVTKMAAGLDSRNPAMGAARRGSVRPGAQGGARMAPVHVSAGEIVRFRTKKPAAAEPGGQRVDSPRRGRRPHHPRDAADVEAPARKRIKCGPADIAIGEAAPVSRCLFPPKEAPAGARGLGRLSMGANVRKGKAPPAGSRGGA